MSFHRDRSIFHHERDAAPVNDLSEADQIIGATLRPLGGGSHTDQSFPAYIATRARASCAAL